MKETVVLGIETSCDETSCAVVVNGREVLSNVINSQIDIHTLYGGVVPEIASRKHIEKINQVIEEALKGTKATKDDALVVLDFIVSFTNAPLFDDSMAALQEFKNIEIDSEDLAIFLYNLILT